jgi:SAM-dependent methyltransferase
MTSHLNTCRICGAQDNHSTYDAREMMFGTREVFRYFQCTACGCLQIEEIPDNFERFYPPDYYSFNIKPNRPKHNVLYQWLQKQRCRTALFEKGFKFNSLIKSHVKLPIELYKWEGGPHIREILNKCGVKDFSVRFLDVGCGAYSNWLATLARLGFHNLTGADPFIASDQQYGAIRIFKRELNNIEGKFDLITLHHSLEHMPQQLEVLQAARARLKEGGTCLVRIPIVSSLAWEKYGVNWVELDAPRHLYLHSLGSITDIARRAGLVLTDIVYDSLSLEFFGSEQYLRDIPLNDPNSLWKNPDSRIFTPEEKACFEAMSAKANTERCGGRAGFYFRASRETK